MKKKTLVLFISIIGLLVISVLLFGTATPNYGDTHENGTCHGSSGGYSISSTALVKYDTSFIFNVTASGSNLFIQAYPDAKNNNDFNILPSNNKILDASGDDFDLNPDAMIVVFNVTPTVERESYTLFIIAGDDIDGGQEFAYIEIIIGSPPPIDLLSIIFNHSGIYLGLTALLLVSLGTVLVLVNENKFVKVHGILAGSSWILTVINLGAAIVRIPIESWINVVPQIYYHVPHMILGSLGLISGFFSMLFGIAAERKPALITGYITLVSWWTAFLFGYFINPYLFVLF